MADRIYTGDSAFIESALQDEEGEGEVPVSSAIIQIAAPSGNQLIVAGLPTTPVAGQRVMLTAAAGGFAANDIVEYNGTVWNKIGEGTPIVIDSENTALFNLSPLLTQEAGLYNYRVQFTTPNDTTHSSIGSFEARDPFASSNPTGIDLIVDRAYRKLEDLFDSELGGPWLQDKTVKSFDREKMAFLLEDALYLVNNGYQPITEFTTDNFPEPHYPLLSQALLVESIYHLIRSYVEQPLPTGANISYFDRRDYMARWQSVLEKEEARLMARIDTFKLEYTGFGASAVLVGGYNNPMLRLSKVWRTRHPRYIGPWRV